MPMEEMQSILISEIVTNQIENNISWSMTCPECNILISGSINDVIIEFGLEITEFSHAFSCWHCFTRLRMRHVNEYFIVVRF